MRAYRKGRVALANAVGTGVADDKAVYAYMPRIIKYYLDQEPIIPNVETQICREKDALAFTLDQLKELVVKPVGESGGYGITVGPKSSGGGAGSLQKTAHRQAGELHQPADHRPFRLSDAGQYRASAAACRSSGRF